MGWKGAVRSIAATQRRAEREAIRRQRELERQHKQLEKMEGIERAAYEVQVYENYIERIQSVHKECADQWNWDTVKSTPPSKPERSDFYEHEEAAKTELAQFKPSILDKVLGRTDAKRASLTEAIEEAKKSDQQEYELATTNYNQEYENWEILCKVADKVLAGDPAGYLEAIEQANPFDEVEELGSGLKIGAESNQPIEANIYVHSEEIIPTEAKTQLKSGKLSIKKMPKTKFYERNVSRIVRQLH